MSVAPVDSLQSRGDGNPRSDNSRLHDGFPGRALTGINPCSGEDMGYDWTEASWGELGVAQRCAKGL